MLLSFKLELLVFVLILVYGILLSLGFLFLVLNVMVISIIWFLLYVIGIGFGIKCFWVLGGFFIGFGVLVGIEIVIRKKIVFGLLLKLWLWE